MVIYKWYETTPVLVYLVTKGIYVLAVNEGWVETDTDQLTMRELIPTGYELIISPPS